MTTSDLTGNFDLCIELTDAVLTGFAGPMFDGTTQASQLPSSIEVAGASLPLGGQAALNIKTATLAAAPAPPAQLSTAVVTINFVDSSLILTKPKAANAEPLEGVITVTGVPFTLAQTGGGTETLELDFTASSVNISPTNGIQWLGNSLDSIENAFAQAYGLKPSANMIEPALAQGVTAALQKSPGKVKINSAVFHIAPAGQNGTLGQAATPGQPAQPPQFNKVDVRTLAAAPGRPGVLCILGTIFQQDVAGDDKAAKTVTATNTSHQGSLAISPDGFQNLFIKAANDSGDLPAGTTITTTLENNQIGLQIAGSASGTGYTATWTIDGHMLAGLSNGALSLNLTVDNQSASADLDWWVWLLGGPAIGGIIDAVVNSDASAKVQSMIPTLMKDVDQSNTAISGIPLTFDTVAVQPQGIVMQGTAQIASGVSTDVQGMVTNSSEAPIVGATVTIDPEGSPVQASTDAHGRYLFNAFALDPLSWPGPFTITAGQADYLTGTGQVSIIAGQPVVKDFVLQKVLDITVKGKVLGNGAPVTGATVTLAYGEPPEQLTGQISAPPTGSNGLYSITTNPHQYNGGYSVTATAPGFDPQLKTIDAIPNGGTVEEDFDLVPPHPFTVMGQVTVLYQTAEDQTVSPAVGASISVFPTTQPSPPLQTYTGQTDQQGKYSIDNVSPGTYTGSYNVLVEAKDVGSQKQQVAQPTGGSIEVDFALTRTMLGHPVKPGTAM